MIAKLRGLLDAVGDDWAVIDVGGVGYLVYCPARVLSGLPAAGGQVTLFVETHVREDHIHLYGFAEPAERDWFRLLQAVQGVGSKAALAILGVLSTDRLIRAIAAQDRAALTRAPGVGPKLAARVLSELKDRAVPAALGSAARPDIPARAAAPAEGALGEAVSALVNLGYAPSDALGAIGRAAQGLGDGADVAALIKAGLGELAPAEKR